MKVAIIKPWGEGGHVTQFEAIAPELRKLGVLVDLFRGMPSAVNGYDVVHVYKVPAAEVRFCHDAGARVVMSPIHWPIRYRGALDPTLPNVGLRRRLTLAAQGARAGWRLQPKAFPFELSLLLDEARALESADVLVPNAVGEEADVRRDYGITTPAVIVTNATSVDEIPCRVPWLEREKRVVCVGRFEPHKNQLGLVDALRGTGWKLTLIGFRHPDHPDYIDRCQRLGGIETTIIVDASRAQIMTELAKARAHILPSWFETTGLVSLEAAAAGCSVATTSRGHASEYFKSDAHYCDPAVPESVREAVGRALEQPPSPNLEIMVRTDCTWERAAQQTLRAYEMAIAGIG